MKPGTRLDSAVFQLTPTRTRCDLIITANGKKEKIASGLLNPFLAHLKTARDQIEKGGYSIVLKLEPDSDATWFTKITVERFVRFVSTPEVLERVYTLESEILQIEEAIAIQSNNEIGLSTAEDHREKVVESSEGTKLLLSANEEKAIVLYKPELHSPEANGSTTKEGNSTSKVQLLRVLETRKTVLQKEQGMAFARAVAAGFEVDHMAPLISFAELFGASRLMDACLKFMDLWKRKHETGQWVEIEAAEAVSPPDFSSMNASGIMLNITNNQKELSEGWPESSTDLGPENNRRASSDAGIDDKFPKDQCPPFAKQEYMQGQIPHPMFPPWPMHSPPGTMPMYQAYPMPGIPYYQNYPGNGPYPQPQYPSVEDPRTNSGHRTRRRRNSMDSGDSNTESGSSDNKQKSRSRESRKKNSHSGKKKSGVVVVRNINYIASKKQNSSDGESESEATSDHESDGSGEFQDTDADMGKQGPLRSADRRGNHTKSHDTYKKDRIRDEADGGQWQAFQNYLLRDADEEKQVVDHGMLGFEEEVKGKRRQIRAGEDPLVFGKRAAGEAQENWISDFQSIGGNIGHMPKASKDEMVLSGRGGHSGDGRGDIDGQLKYSEIEGRRGVHRRATDDFLIHGRENQSDLLGSSDPLAVNGFERVAGKVVKNLSNAMADESFIVPSRSGTAGQVGTDYKSAIDMDSELPSLLQKADNPSNTAGGQVNYEPDDLCLMPERDAEKGSIAYDPAFDYEMQVQSSDASTMVNKNAEDVSDVKHGSKKLDKAQRLKVTPDALEKKRTMGAKRGKPSKLSPLDEARARAERLRSFKADLQKVKKEKEEEAIKRLEALKLERQKRIAARSGSVATSSPLPSKQTQKQIPTKRSPGSQKGSKFSDSEPGSASPLQRAPKKIISSRSTDSPVASKPGGANNDNRSGNRLTRSVSSLPEPKKENKGTASDSKASMERIRRLSEPKVYSSQLGPSTKLQDAVTVSKIKPSEKPESKKISAIMNLDKTKAASLPELKIRASKGPSNEILNIPTAEEMTQTVNESKLSRTAEAHNLNGNTSNILDNDVADDNSVIEKTVLILECEKPSALAIHASDDTGEVLKGQDDGGTPKGKIEMVSEYIPIHASVSEFNMDGVDREPTDRQCLERPRLYEVAEVHAEESATSSSISVVDRPYQAPYARVSSIEDPCTQNSEYGKAPLASFEMSARADGKALVSDLSNLKLERIPEALDKSQVKESPKGLRRLLKLGRKSGSSAAGERSSESDNVGLASSEAADYAANAVASTEVHMLKNLISQDETPSASTTQKSSRPFSLLSPFRSKNSEKKLTT